MCISPEMMFGECSIIYFADGLCSGVRELFERICVSVLLSLKSIRCRAAGAYIKKSVGRITVF